MSPAPSSEITGAFRKGFSNLSFDGRNVGAVAMAFVQRRPTAKTVETHYIGTGPGDQSWLVKFFLPATSFLR
jgi:hypothetical protein